MSSAELRRLAKEIVRPGCPLDTCREVAEVLLWLAAQTDGGQDE